MREDATLSALAEIAIRRLAVRTSSHAVELVRTVGEAGRHIPARELDSNSNALVDLVAVTESYFADRLAEAVPGPAQPGTWRARAEVWRDKAGVDIAAHPCWPKLMGFVEARNALQHGLGRLTEMQLDAAVRKGREPRRAQVLRDLAASGLVVNGDRVTVLPNDVERCAAVCRELILAADTSLPGPASGTEA